MLFQFNSKTYIEREREKKTFFFTFFFFNDIRRKYDVCMCDKNDMGE